MLTRGARIPIRPVTRVREAPEQSTTDFDGDGVTDSSDACPGIARGTGADGDGCPGRPAKQRNERRLEGDEAKHQGHEPSRINMLGPFRKRALRPKAVIALWVMRPGTIGQVVKFTIRKGKKPKQTRMCVPPGASKARARC
jgi:hypothetical protein